MMLGAGRHVVDRTRRRIKPWIKNDRREPRRRDEVFERFAHAKRFLIATRCLKGEQQLEVVERLDNYERLALAARSVAERVFVLKVNAQVGLVFQEAFNLVTTE